MSAPIRLILERPITLVSLRVAVFTILVLWYYGIRVTWGRPILYVWSGDAVYQAGKLRLGNSDMWSGFFGLAANWVKLRNVLLP